MAHRYLQQFFFSFIRKLTCLTGTIAIGSDAAVGTVVFPGASVAKTGTGAYTITFKDKYVALSSCTLTLEAATAVDLVPQIVSTDVSGAKTIVFKLLAGASTTDPGAACKVHVRALMRDSSIVQ